jgi:DNA-binding winged helix-turn-helix (wHTH) protein
LATASSTSAGTSFAAPEPVEPQVLDVLALLLRERERVVPKEELLDAVRGSRFIGESALTSRVKTARRAIGDDGRTQQLIRTVHGRGYQFVGQVQESMPRPRPCPLHHYSFGAPRPDRIRRSDKDPHVPVERSISSRVVEGRDGDIDGCGCAGGLRADGSQGDACQS